MRWVVLLLIIPMFKFTSAARIVNNRYLIDVTSNPTWLIVKINIYKCTYTYLTYANVYVQAPLPYFCVLGTTFHSDVLGIPPGAFSISKLSSVVIGQIWATPVAMKALGISLAKYQCWKKNWICVFIVCKYRKVRNTTGGGPPISYRTMHGLWMNFSFLPKINCNYFKIHVMYTWSF